MTAKPAKRPPRRPKLDDPTDCLCSSLRRTTRAITQIYDEALSPYGLTSTQFCVLSAIEKAAPVAMKKLAAQLGMDRTTLTRLLVPLDRHRLTRNAGSSDRREHQVALTPGGAARLRAAKPAWLKAQREVTQALGEAKATLFLGDLEVVRTVTAGSRERERIMKKSFSRP